MTRKPDIDPVIHNVDECAESADNNHDVSETDPHVHDAPTVDYYRRRQHLIAGTNCTEWWMVAGIVLLTASLGLITLY